MLGIEPLLLQETAGHGGDEGRIESGKACELDANLVSQSGLLGMRSAGLGLLVALL
jgi:hypothetical protein